MSQLFATPGIRICASSRRTRGGPVRHSIYCSRALAKPASSESVSDSDDYPSSIVGSTKTSFVAETNLPTRNGKYRLRGYRHTVRRALTAPLRFARPPCTCGWSVFAKRKRCVKVRAVARRRRSRRSARQRAGGWVGHVHRANGDRVRPAGGSLPGVSQCHMDCQVFCARQPRHRAQM